MPTAVHVGKRLEINRIRRNRATLIRLSGVIDDTFSQLPLMGMLRGSVAFDLDRVDRITSYGVREWMSGLKTTKAEYICFLRCRPAIVSQFNMVSNFAGPGQLVSFYAPYVCPACRTEIDGLVDLRKGAPIVQELLTIPCTSCDQTGVFDDVAEAYFSYACAMAPPTIPPALEALIEPSGASRFRIEKEVSGDVPGVWFSGALEATRRYAGSGWFEGWSVAFRGIKGPPDGLPFLGWQAASNYCRYRVL